MAPPDPSVVRIDGPWRHLEVHANGIRFHVVEAEAKADETAEPVTERPLVILLHGFGSFWWSWRHQLRGLRNARVVAVDAATAAATSHHVATTAGHWPATPLAWSARLVIRRRHWSATPTVDWSAGRRRCCIHDW